MSSTLQRGSSVAHYKIVERIGAGGMGEVWKAEDQKLDRSVALKILPPDLVRDADRVRRFVQEAKSASSLSHPHIVTIHDIGDVTVSDPDSADKPGEEIHYIAMELVDGSTLTEKIHREGSDLRDLLRWLSQAADGLAKAHANGIVHRDMKPDNVMVTRDGFAKVLDFGLAKLTEPDAPDIDAPTQVRNGTGKGAVLGTVGYMSPEQVAGKVADFRADVFSFGCILYEAATRRKPFQGSTDVDVMHEILRGNPPPVSGVNLTAPIALQRMIRRCMEKDPEKRYQSMKDLAIALSDMAEDYEALLQETSTLSDAGARLVVASRSRWPWMVLGLVGIIVAFLAGSRVGRQGETLPSDVTHSGAIELHFTQVTTDPGPETWPTLSPDGNFVAYESVANGNTDIRLLRIGGRNSINLTEGSESNDWRPAFSPDGERIAFRSERDGGGIYTMGATGESVRKLTDFGFAPSWSPDGSKIVFDTEGATDPRARSTVAELWTVDLASGETRKVHDGDAVDPVWSPDGQRIAFWGLPDRNLGHRDIATIPATGGEVVWLTRDPVFDWRPVWGPDSRTIYFSSDRGGSMNIWRLEIDPDSGLPRGEPQQLTTPSQWAGYAAMSADGKTMVYSSVDFRSIVEIAPFNPATRRIDGAPRVITRGSDAFVSPSISPAGDWIVFASQEKPEDLFVVKSDGSSLVRLTDDGANDRSPRWSPDGHEIFFYSDRSGRYEIWSIGRDGSGLRQVTKTEGRSYWFPVVSPDGTKLLVANEQGSTILDLPAEGLATKAESLPKPEDSGAIFMGRSWSANGREIFGSEVSTNLQSLSIMSYSLETRELTRHIALPPFFDRVFSFKNGRHVVVSTGPAIRVFDLQSGGSDIILEAAPGEEFQSLSLSGDERLLAFGRSTTEADIWIATIEE